VYDNQTRSMLQTDQDFPQVSSQDKGWWSTRMVRWTCYFGPKAPAGMENNWIQTIPGKGWNMLFRLYGPLDPWFDKTWKLSEIELVKFTTRGTMSARLHTTMIPSACPFRHSLLPLLLLILVLSGCAGPVGVRRISPENSYMLSTENPLGQGKMSNNATTVLHRYNLVKKIADDPEKTIQQLHDLTKIDDRRDILFALSELSYLRGEKLLRGSLQQKKQLAQDYFLQSAVYAYFYLLGDGREPLPSAYDIRFREACDLYNRALWRSFPENQDKSLIIAGGERHLPAGDLTVVLKAEDLTWKLENIIGFFPSDAYKIHGFTVRNRTPGLGLPLIGLTRKTKESPNGGVIPITAFLRLPKGIKDYHRDDTTATLELYSAYDSAEVQVNEQSVPLETDSTTPLAFRLNKSDQWNIGVKRFLTGGAVDRRLLLIQPYTPGRIPVVFVHGTASSPAWWAEMLNTLRADPDIRKRFQFWFYQYNSSNLIVISAAEMREVLTDMVNKLDPQQTDPALREMVVIGHSQGGLLTKMTAVRPEDKLWNAISDKRVEEMSLDRDMEALVRRTLFFEPLPFVKRVVFISTPHRGSYLTKNWVRYIVNKTITFPLEVTMKTTDGLRNLTGRLKLPAAVRGRIPSSIDGMSADNPLLQALVAVPLRPGVPGHSIISVKPGMDIATGNDGVVEYASAHIDGVESEFVVRSSHSCQEHPFTIEEVRRILLKHIGMGVDTHSPVDPIPLPAVSIWPVRSAQGTPAAK
jgi:pimeloyl-ACP methyl ester carboxylesterase